MPISVRKTALVTVLALATMAPPSLASAQPTPPPPPTKPPAAKAPDATAPDAEAPEAEAPEAEPPEIEPGADPDEKPESPPDDTQALPNKLGSEQLAVVRKSYQAGQTKLDEQDYAAALPLFERADAIARVPTTRLQVARCLDGLGKLIEAREKAHSVAALPRTDEPNPSFEKARKLARELVQKLDQRIAHFKVTVLPATSSVTVDGVVISVSKRRDLELDPGKHTLKVSAPTYLDSIEPFDLVEGETKIITITLAPNPATVASASAIPTAFDSTGPHFGPIAAVGTVIGGLGILTGAIAGGIALDRAAPIQDDCTFGDGNDCIGMKDDVDAAKLAAHVSTAGFVVAGVGLGTALLGVFVIDKPGSNDIPDKTVSLHPLLGPSYVGIAGRF